MSTTTSNRRLLVIGSQCEALGEGYRLKFLPRAAEELYTVLIDPDLGQCLPVQPDGGLLIDPTVAAVKTAISGSLPARVRRRSTLLLAFIGHGTYVGSDFFFLPLDAASAADPDTGIHLVQQSTYALPTSPLEHRRPGRARSIPAIPASRPSGPRRSGSASTAR